VKEKPPTKEVELKSTLVETETNGVLPPAVVKRDAVCLACANQTHRGSMTAWIFRREQHTCNQSVAKTVDKPFEPTIGKVESEIAHQFGDKYEVMGLLGQGGMGSVYKVKDRDLNAFFAIKVLRTEFAKEAGAVKRFEQEAVSASQLTHPNLVAVYKHGIMDRAQGEPFLIMDYVEGDSLSALIMRDGYMPVPRALEIFIQTCDAVSHAHMKGLLHRDLKPSNVLIARSENGTDFVKLVDFGIAKILPAADVQNPGLTQTGELLGSPLYMSPEQCLGELLDVRSDIYSLGCLMYEVLSGAPPFSAPNPIKIIFKHLNEIPSPIRRPLSGHEIPPPLEAMVLRCLEKKPADRYQSVAELASDLVLLRDGKKTKWQKKLVARNIFPVKKAAMALALCCTAVGAAWFANSTNSNGGIRPSGPTTTVQTASVAPTATEKNVLIDSCTREIANHPRDPNWYFMRGTAYREIGEHKKALSDLTKALSLNPPNLKEVFRARAWTYNQLDEYRKSLADCNAAIKIDPSYEEAYISRSRAYCGLGNAKAGLADADRGVQLNPTDYAAYWNRACCYAAVSQHQAAVDDFTKALKLQPGELRILVGRSRSYVVLGLPRKAIEDLSTLVAANPSDYPRLVERADLYTRIGEPEKALADANAAIAMAPPTFEVGLAVRAGALAQLGRWEEAMRSYIQALQINDRDAEAWKGIGDLWMKRNEYDRAVEKYSKAIECAKSWEKFSTAVLSKSATRDALEARAKAYELLGKKDLARRDLDDARQTKVPSVAP
jgi:serine/threonine protein kinase